MLTDYHEKVESLKQEGTNEVRDSLEIQVQLQAQSKEEQEFIDTFGKTSQYPIVAWVHGKTLRLSRFIPLAPKAPDRPAKP